jgi:hypothetical protein
MYENGRIPGQYPPIYPSVYELPPQSLGWPPQVPPRPKKGGLLSKLGRSVTNVAHGLEKVATSEKLERGIRGVATGIERAAKSEFIANVGREFRAAVDNLEAQKLAAQQHQTTQQTALNALYQQPYVPVEALEQEQKPAVSPSPVAASPSPEPHAQQAAPVDGASLFADIPRVNGSLIHDPQTLAIAQNQRCNQLKTRFEQLRRDGYTDEQLRPLFNEYLSTHELWKQANEMQQKWIMSMVAMPMRPMNSSSGFAALSSQMHTDTMSGIASLTAGSSGSGSGSGSYYNSNSYYGTNSYYGNSNPNTWSYSY